MAKTKQPDIGEAHTDKADPKAAPFNEAAFKAWVRHEIALAARGASEEEREVLNP